METAKRVNLIMAFTGCQQCLAISVCMYVPVVPTVLLYSPKYSERHAWVKSVDRSDATSHGEMHALFAHGLRCSVLTLVLRNLDNPVFANSVDPDQKWALHLNVFSMTSLKFHHSSYLVSDQCSF